VQEENFAPSHHRSASLPNRLARSQTISTNTPASLKEVEEPEAEAASRKSGKYKARASLPIINTVIKTLTGGDKPAPIAE
jgi:hypothetical protein